jgi:hypothetical protein
VRWLLEKAMVRFLSIVAPLPRECSGSHWLILSLVFSEQVAAIGQQGGNAIEAVQIFRIRIRFCSDPLELQFQGAKPLLELHQTLGESCHGLRQILRGSRNPERHRFAGHVVNSR